MGAWGVFAPHEYLSVNISLLLLVNFPLHGYFLYFARFQTKMGNWSQYPFSDQNGAKAIPFGYRVFWHDVTAAILGDEFFSYANAFFCSRKSSMWLISGNTPHDRTFTVMWKVLLMKAHLFDEIHGAIYYHSINQSGFLTLLEKKLWCFMTSTEFPPAESKVQSAQIDCLLIRYQCIVFSRSFKTFIFPKPTRSESEKKNCSLKSLFTYRIRDGVIYRLFISGSILKLS